MLLEPKSKYMNFHLTQIPARTPQPRQFGLTMITDKGMSAPEMRNVLSVAGGYIDMVKLAFGTSYVMPGVMEEKLAVCRSYGVPVFLGGLLLEAFLIRDQLKDYIRLVEEWGLSYIEFSDGSINITHAEKCGYIEQLSRYAPVVSEIGSKDKDTVHVTPPYKWIEMIHSELSAGAQYIIAEARETGTVGLYRNSGEVREGLVQEILSKIPAEKMLWETPQKDQQLFFIELLGCNANLGNIDPHDVIALEAMRVGLRGDSFEFFLDKQR